MSEAARSALHSLAAQMEQSVIGQSHVVRSLILALLSNSNVLLEGLPAKTRSIKTLARVLRARLGRIQFTPDLLPADVTGSETYHEADGAGQLSFEPSSSSYLSASWSALGVIWSVAGCRSVTRSRLG